MLILLAACVGPADTASESGHSAELEPTRSISGLVYAFKSRDFLEGATIGLHEHPERTTTTAADGTWSFEGLAVGETVTPWIELEGYREASHRSFTLDQDQERVYFQAIPTAVYDLMFQALVNSGVEIDAEACHLASTVTDPHMKEISTWAEFDAFIPHGLAGATVSQIPGSEHAVIYFNEDVFPDPTMTETSIDGGVIVPNLGEGTHTLTAQDGGAHAFDTIRIQCAPGRFVNASPPWGIGAQEG